MRKKKNTEQRCQKEFSKERLNMPMIPRHNSTYRGLSVHEFEQSSIRKPNKNHHRNHMIR